MAPAAALMVDPRVSHYWDGDDRLGAAFSPHLGLSFPAWDVWLLFAPGVRWEGAAPPEPTWWEHQLPVLGKELRLDAARFAGKAVELARRKD